MLRREVFRQVAFEEKGEHIRPRNTNGGAESGAMALGDEVTSVALRDA